MFQFIVNMYSMDYSPFCLCLLLCLSCLSWPLPWCCHLDQACIAGGGRRVGGN